MSDDVVALIARELQFVPVLAVDAPLLMPAVVANNERIARLAHSCFQMEDHPGTFDPWCRNFVSVSTP